MIKAVSFDLWDTLVCDDSDEPVRAARGLASKPDARRALFADEVRAHHDVPEAEAVAAWDAATDWFRHQWKVLHRTPSVAMRVEIGLEKLSLPRPAGFDTLVAALETMEVEIPPDPTPGAVECLAALRGRYRLAIVSDAIVTPGRLLRQIMAQHGLFDPFELFVFSDEAGAAKPDPRVFARVCNTFEIAPNELVHIGDRESNDILGPKHFGAYSILYTGAVDRGSDVTEADAVCAHHRDLPALIEELGR